MDGAHRVHVQSPAPRAVWSQVLAADPQSMVQQTPSWFAAVLQASGGTDASRLYTLPDGRRIVLPVVRRTLLPGVALDGAFPGTYGPGGLIADGGLRPSDVRTVLDDLRRSSALSTRLRAGHASAAAWESAPVGVRHLPGRTHVLDLSGGFPEVLARRFAPSARRGIRKAERSGLEVQWTSGPGLVPAFYELYLRWTARRAEESGVSRVLALALARRREPLAKFTAVTSALGDGCRTWVASAGGEPVAAIITLAHGRHAAYWRGYSHKPVAGPLRANLLLQHLAIQHACEAGRADYDLGESGEVRSLERFKESLGARSKPTVDLRIERLPLTRLQRAVSDAEARVARGLARRVI
ncbi:GNAT family N-acetyltransferase [Nocardioides sp. IC4_145]|uniref:GNAT family N-acetyltransferase n=1 Tax=Nocardioides sp. IC4_145 TaxID=2714037 RepID=UPI0014078547|nr:GNAT family N-acetyltransferase [Nocardioides sp. IC4_145]NHC24557.1 GNAT family N-acetyltransferase [Nocardioides sp. IC4_145]